jgi:acyl carrier protein
VGKDEFIAMIRHELALPLEVTDPDTGFDQVVSWDSMQMLQLVVAVEARIGHRLPVGRLLANRNLGVIYDRIMAVVSGTCEPSTVRLEPV